MRTLIVSLLAVLGALLLPALARADGFIIVSDSPARPDHFGFAPLEVVYHRVSVQIKGNVATTHVDQEFYNPNARQLEGTYLFPLPEGAHIDRFAMDVNGTMTPAELLDADRARQIYEEIVRKYRDPALLEYVGRDAFKVRIFPIEPNGKKHVKITYTQILKEDSGLTEYTYPLNTEKFSARPLKDVSVKVTLACDRPIKSVYSPSHEVDVTRDGDRGAVVGFEAKDVRPDTDFRLIYSTEDRPVGLDVLTYRNSPDEGYFLLLASPGSDQSQAQVQPRDLCFVLDTSGSMAGPKMEQAKKALLFCLANLNEGDRFEIIRFSTEAEAFNGSFAPADKESVEKAYRFIRDLKPRGGTAINDALAMALRIHREQRTLERLAPRPYVIIFLTDGQPTIGETDPDRISALLKPAQGEGSSGQAIPRIFSFGIGTDINTHLLDRIANQTRAFSQYVLPDEDIEVKVSQFYSKIQSPVLTDVKLSAAGGDVRLAQVYPNIMPDLFKGETLVAFGRYSGTGKATVRVTGTLNGQPREFVTEVDFAEHDLERPFIPRLWATRRVGWLLDEIRLNGETQELKDEVVRLAREHGVVTPYTAYLILEDEQVREVPVALRTLREMEADREAIGRVRAQYIGAQQVYTGERAVQDSVSVNALKGGASESQALNGLGLAKAEPASRVGDNAGYKATSNYAQQVRFVKGRAFYQNGATWTDAQAQHNRNLKRQDVTFNSAEYFALLQQHPAAAAWLALGEEVDLVLGDTLYVIR